MGWKSAILKPWAWKVARDIDHWAARPLAAQASVLRDLVRAGRRTQFGRDHGFDLVGHYDAFRQRVPLRDYEGLRPYIDRIRQGESDVLWPGRPAYFAKTSGTTSGVKYIPLTRASLPNHFGTARNALFNYYGRTGRGEWLDGKMIFLSGSPEMDDVAGIPTGRLSGIVNHQVPAWLRSNQMPSYQTNCIEDWEKKLDAIVEETRKVDMRLISGIPPWVQMYFERLLERTGKGSIMEVFPHFSMLVYGGVNYEPYRDAMEQLIGRRVDTVETYPASEGFVAFQDRDPHEGLLLNVRSGIFFEFIPADRIGEENPPRLWLEEVQTGVNYAIVLNNNAGLWGYDLGDTVEFLSLDPPRLRVTGRTKHFISAFGEHVIGKEVEQAMQETAKEQGLRVIEFTVAPQVKPPEGGLPYHEWFVEFEEPPENLRDFAARLDASMVNQNIYYEDLIQGNILRPLKLRCLRRDAFRDYMKSRGKLGGQNKVPRLANDRSLADALEPFVLEKYNF